MIVKPWKTSTKPSSDVEFSAAERKLAARKCFSDTAECFSFATGRVEREKNSCNIEARCFSRAFSPFKHSENNKNAFSFCFSQWRHRRTSKKLEKHSESTFLIFLPCSFLDVSESFSFKKGKPTPETNRDSEQFRKKKSFCLFFARIFSREILFLLCYIKKN